MAREGGLGPGNRRVMREPIKKEMSQLSATAMIGRSYLEVVKSHTPMDKLCKGQEGSKSSVIETLQTEVLEEDLQKLYECYVGETYSIDQPASVWGNLISLDRATSFKKRFDVARVLISTEVCSPILKTILVMVDGHKFLIQAIEESTEEMIFSRGPDREKVSRSDDGRHELPSSSVVPCSLVDIRCNGREAPPETTRGIKAEKNSKPLENNDEMVSNSGGVGQSHHVRYVRQEANTSSSVELLQSGDVSSPRKRAKKVIIMGDRIEVIKRREENGCCTPFASLKSLDTSQK
ncbi:hypothetical protein Ancab_016779 [Ancistrocladus abbreviatus]